MALQDFSIASLCNFYSSDGVMFCSDNFIFGLLRDNSGAVTRPRFFAGRDGLIYYSDYMTTPFYSLLGGLFLIEFEGRDCRVYYGTELVADFVCSAIDPEPITNLVLGYPVQYGNYSVADIVTEIPRAYIGSSGTNENLGMNFLAIKSGLLTSTEKQKLYRYVFETVPVADYWGMAGSMSSELVSSLADVTSWNHFYTAEQAWDSNLDSGIVGGGDARYFTSWLDQSGNNAHFSWYRPGLFDGSCVVAANGTVAMPYAAASTIKIKTVIIDGYYYISSLILILPSEEIGGASFTWYPADLSIGDTITIQDTSVIETEGSFWLVGKPNQSLSEFYDLYSGTVGSVSSGAEEAALYAFLCGFDVSTATIIVRDGITLGAPETLYDPIGGANPPPLILDDTLKTFSMEIEETGFFDVILLRFDDFSTILGLAYHRIVIGSTTDFVWAQPSAAQTDVYYSSKTFNNLLSDYRSYINLPAADIEDAVWAKTYVPTVSGDTLRIAFNTINLGGIPPAGAIGQYGIISACGPYAAWQRQVTNSDFLGTVLEVDFTPLTDSYPTGIYYAWQHGFDSGQGFYFGIQTRAAGFSGNPKGFIFSVWDATSGSSPGYSGAFGGEGVGWQTLISHDWVTERTYRFRLVKNNSTTWSCYVKDMVTTTEYFIGSITSPGATGGIQETAYTWVERYSGPTLSSCSEIPYSAFTVEPVTSDWLNVSNFYDLNGYCRNSVSQSENGGTKASMSMGGTYTSANFIVEVNNEYVGEVAYSSDSSNHYVFVAQPGWTLGEEAFIDISLQKPTDVQVAIEIESIAIGDSSMFESENTISSIESVFDYQAFSSILDILG